MGKWIVCATTAVLLALVAAAVCAPWRPIPRPLNAIDRAATEIAETADAVEQVTRWVHAKCRAWDREGKIRGRLMLTVLGVPIMALEAELDLPKQE